MLERLEALAQPVALIAWLLVVLAWLARRARAPVAVRRVAAAAAVLYFAASTPLVANLAVGVLEGAAGRSAAACAAPAASGAFVVLAGGMSGQAASRDDFVRLHAASVRRLVEGVRRARSTADAPLVLSGGAGDGVREADLMAALAAELGFPPGRVLLERDSTTTAEAAVNVARLLRDRGLAPKVVWLVTSALHVPRAAAAFRRQGLPVCPVPVDRRLVRPGLDEALLPQITALEKTTAVYHEAVGYLVYWVTGRL